MKRYVIVLCILLAAPQVNEVWAQKIEYTYRNPKDSTFNAYLVLIPEKSEVNGVIIRDYSSLPSPKDLVGQQRFQWRDMALDNGLAVLYTVSSNYFPELFYDDSVLETLDDIIGEAIDKYDLPRQNVFIGGISASGTRAMRYAQYCEQGKSKNNVDISGVFSVDSPLDLERFYYSARNHKANFKEGMVWEAELMMRVFPDRFGGSPEEKAAVYRKQSVYSNNNPEESNARYLLNTPVLMYHEPDINWWTTQRGASYFDINSYDIAGLYTYLMGQDHPDVELITTTGKGFDKQGNRNCHSWTIVDEEQLIDWIVDRLNK